MSLDIAYNIAPGLGEHSQINSARPRANIIFPTTKKYRYLSHLSTIFNHVAFLARRQAHSILERL